MDYYIVVKGRYKNFSGLGPYKTRKRAEEIRERHFPLRDSKVVAGKPVSIKAKPAKAKKRVAVKSAKRKC